MPYLNIYLHVIWSTKNRAKLITKELKQILIEHIKTNAKEKGIFILAINCVQDHIHLLISLGADQTIAKVTQLIKGESSHWNNKNKLLRAKFECQNDYIAVSVSKSIIDKVKKYIENQEEHQRIKSFSEEFEEFKIKYGFDDLR